MKSNFELCDVADAARLFGTDRDTVLRRVEAGKFSPKPSGELHGAPVWQRDDIERAANDYWRGRSDGMVWLHPKTWSSADAAASELIFYRSVGASIYQTAEGPFVIYAPIGAKPSRTLRIMQRYGENIDWQLRQFDPRPTPI